MATSNYKPYQRSGEPFTLGYYVFTLPSGAEWDMLSDEAVVLPDGDLSKLPARYVERDVRFFGDNPPSPKGKTMRLPIVPVSPIRSTDVIDNLESLSDEEMERIVFGNAERV